MYILGRQKKSWLSIRWTTSIQLTRPMASSRNRRGLFLVIEGPDGVGKTTAAKALISYLRRSLGLAVTYTHEPTSSRFGRAGRALVLDGASRPRELADLFIADREHHLRTLIVPRLRAGHVLVADRYKYSTVVYQTLQGLDADTLVSQNRFLAPHITVVLLCSPRTLEKRLRERDGRKANIRDRRYLGRVVRAYRRLATHFPGERIVYIDAEVSKTDVARAIRAELASLVRRRAIAPRR